MQELEYRLPLPELENQTKYIYLVHKNSSFIFRINIDLVRLFLSSFCVATEA